MEKRFERITGKQCGRAIVKVPTVEIIPVLGACPVLERKGEEEDR